MRAAGYIRVSTDEQVKHGWNLGADKQRVEEIADDKGWDLVEIFDDGGLQGDDPDRPGFNRMLDTLDQCDVIIMRSLDRLSRDTFLYALATKAIRDAGVQIESFNGPVDLESPEGELSANVLAAIHRFEKRQIGVRVKQAMRARAAAGLHAGGIPPYGYRWEDKTLVIVDREAEIIVRIFTDYVQRGMSQRAIVRALNDDKVPTQHGGHWQQSAIARILANVIYTGKLEFKDQILDGAHKAIVSDELWNRAQAIRTGAQRSKGGRHADGGHLLTRGVLRCTCGSAMIPRKARPGQERERYVCRGRIEDPKSCSQPSIRRELIDQPFLAHLLDGYIDIEATAKRIEERTASAVTLAREALSAAEAEVLRTQEALARIERDYHAGDISGKQWAAQEAKLTVQLEAAQEAVRRAQEHVQQTEQAGVAGDAEQALLDHLAALKKAASAQADAAPDLNALRNVIGQMFESVQLVRSGEWPRVPGDGFIPFDGDIGPVPTIESREQRYWLLPTLRWSAVDRGTFKPTGQEMPVGSMLQYPPSDTKPFLARYCWWYSSA